MLVTATDALVALPWLTAPSPQLGPSLQHLPVSGSKIVGFKHPQTRGGEIWGWGEERDHLSPSVTALSKPNTEIQIVFPLTICGHSSQLCEEGKQRRRNADRHRRAGLGKGPPHACCGLLIHMALGQSPRFSSRGITSPWKITLVSNFFWICLFV